MLKPQLTVDQLKRAKKQTYDIHNHLLLADTQSTTINNNLSQLLLLRHNIQNVCQVFKDYQDMDDTIEAAISCMRTKKTFMLGELVTKLNLIIRSPSLDGYAKMRASVIVELNTSVKDTLLVKIHENIDTGDNEKISRCVGLAEQLDLVETVFHFLFTTYIEPALHNLQTEEEWGRTLGSMVTLIDDLSSPKLVALSISTVMESALHIATKEQEPAAVGNFLTIMIWLQDRYGESEGWPSIKEQLESMCNSTAIFTLYIEVAVKKVSIPDRFCNVSAVKAFQHCTKGFASTISRFLRLSVYDPFREFLAEFLQNSVTREVCRYRELLNKRADSSSTLLAFIVLLADFKNLVNLLGKEFGSDSETAITAQTQINAVINHMVDRFLQLKMESIEHRLGQIFDDYRRGETVDTLFLSTEMLAIFDEGYSSTGPLEIRYILFRIMSLLQIQCFEVVGKYVVENDANIGPERFSFFSEVLESLYEVLKEGDPKIDSIQEVVARFRDCVDPEKTQQIYEAFKAAFM